MVSLLEERWPRGWFFWAISLLKRRRFWCVIYRCKGYNINIIHRFSSNPDSMIKELIMGFIIMFFGIQLAIGLFFLCLVNFPMLTTVFVIFLALQDCYMKIRNG